MTADNASIHSRVSWLSLSFRAKVRKSLGRADMDIYLLRCFWLVRCFQRVSIELCHLFFQISNSAFDFCIMKLEGNWEPPKIA